MEQSEVVQMPVLFRPEEVAKSRAFGRTAVFELIRTGELRSVKLGKSRRIPAEAVVRTWRVSVRRPAFGNGRGGVVAAARRRGKRVATPDGLRVSPMPVS
jgi:excisionase family DNA binding protein